MMYEDSTVLIGKEVVIGFTVQGSLDWYGTVLGIDERGLIFKGTMERENPNERERKFFVPWSSVLYVKFD